MDISGHIQEGHLVWDETLEIEGLRLVNEDGEVIWLNWTAITNTPGLVAYNAHGTHRSLEERFQKLPVDSRINWNKR